MPRAEVCGQGEVLGLRPSSLSYIYLISILYLPYLNLSISYIYIYLISIFNRYESYPYLIYINLYQSYLYLKIYFNPISISSLSLSFLYQSQLFLYIISYLYLISVLSISHLYIISYLYLITHHYLISYLHLIYV